MKKLIAIGISALMWAGAMAQADEWVTIKNGAAWKDADGNLVQAHGAGFLQVGDTWYMVGEDRSAWRPDVNMYSSKDLTHWKFERKIIQNGVTHSDLGRTRMIERPKIAYCQATGKYVVWCHWESSNYSTSQAAAFCCDEVNGAYEYVWSGRPLNIKSRDCNLFVDDDGAAYFISTTNENTNLGLFRLADDYLSVVEHTLLFPGDKREAPAIVKVDGRYYMLSSACSGWSPNQCKMSSSTSLTGWWAPLTNVGNSFAYDTQPASILAIKGTETTTYLYVGDRWQDPNLPESKTIIFPVSFADGQCQMHYRDQFDINFATGQWRETPTAGTRLGKEGWTVLDCSSEQGEETPAAAAIDGDPFTYWRSQSLVEPQHIAIDLGEETTISGFVAAHNFYGDSFGLFKKYAFMTSLDGQAWEYASGAECGPYWGEVHFQPARARYVKIVNLSERVSATLSELELLTGEPGYEPMAIAPYYKIGSGQWLAGNEIALESGQKLTFGPNVGSVIGTWAVMHPDGTFTHERELVIDAATVDDAGQYVFSFLDCYSNTHLVAYNVAVASGIAAVEAEPIGECCYRLDGVKTDAPQRGVPHIRQQIYSDGTVKSAICVEP